MAYRKEYIRDYFATVRQIVKPGHYDCMQPSCCVDGLRNYNRDKVAQSRALAKATTKRGHRSCQSQSCCADGLRNSYRHWRRLRRKEYTAGQQKEAVHENKQRLQA